MQASRKRTAPDDGEEEQEEQEQQPPRKLPERRSRASAVNYNVREYYRGMRFDHAGGHTSKISSKEPRKKDTPRTLGNTGPDGSHLGTQPTCTHPTLPPSTPTPMWESCFSCIKELCQNPRMTRCKKEPDDPRCFQCMVTNDMCVKIPTKLAPRVVKIQEIATSIISCPRTVGWSNQLSKWENSLRVEFKIFRGEMEAYTTDDDGSISATSPEAKLSIPAHPSTPSPAKTRISFATAPLATLARPKSEVMLPRIVERSSAPASSVSPFPQPTNKDDEDLKHPRPSTPHSLQSSNDPTPVTQIGASHRPFTADSNVFGFPARATAEENNRQDTQPASSDLNNVPFATGAEWLTMFGSIERQLARIADALEAKNRSENGGNRSGNRMNASQAYWE
ncbi:hypothetical protein ACJ72_00018 [Emergomyces africanus]|uniref:Uncharacterized protein n=1 Tax=Emergomyces africanus TaxID=1955775 RepID=A0A1B7P988_9EURO|nr:hypothetical protein ACJ72_00018 [Emergomyces africanus]